MPLNERLILLDLDGPVLDVSPRYHRLHAELVSAAGGTPLSAGEYFSLKRSRESEADIMRRTGVPAGRLAELGARRLELIETRPYLELDRLWPWSLETLAELRRLAPLVLVTQRTRADLLEWQLAYTGVAPFLALVLSGREDETGLAKANRVRRAGLVLGPGSVLVGDTEVDVVSGRELGVATVALRTGIRDDEHLAACRPDVLLDSLQALPRWLTERGR